MKPELLNHGPAAGAVAATMTAGAGGGSIRIWLIDDNEPYRTLLAELLACESDFDCARMFPSAEAALLALGKNPELAPDVILLDIDMDGMSGLDAIEPLRRRAPNTHVLMLTAFFDSHRRACALRRGAADFLLKSYGFDQISRQIRRARERSPMALAVTADADEDPFEAWPKRRALGGENRRITGRGMVEPHPDFGHRDGPRRSASVCRVRGAAFVRSLLRFVFSPKRM